MPPHSCAKPELERVTNRTTRKASLAKENLSIASISSQLIG
jgi:hypothetical protein